jgi:hypothetical protein
MKKIISILGAGIVFISATASSVEDWTFVGSIKAHDTTIRQVHLPKGQVHLNVYSNVDKAKISCQFLYNKVVLAGQDNVDHCVLNPFVPEESTVDVKIINLNNQGIDYKIWVY